MAIHWCGTGLSAIPGLRRLIEKGYETVVWNRTIEKAKKALGDITDNIHAFDKHSIEKKLKPGDIIVSMLPGDWHVPLAELAISKKANFVSSSYIAPEMKKLEGKAKAAGVTLVNEIGLDPGIDHLMAHKLVEEYRNSSLNTAENDLSFVSYCGGIPKISNDFKYKFSWSPLGVLKALKSPSKSIRDYKEFEVDRPWNAISSYDAPLEQPESFEVYPNRDSLPFIKQYHFDPNWKIKEFVRGTLRLNGWSKAWQNVFEEIEMLCGPTGETRLQEMSDQFWRDNSYEEGEPDRVVLCVGLKAQKENITQWHKTYVMDAWGDKESTAMARLVSFPLSYSIEAILLDKIPPGVHAASDNLILITEWLEKISKIAQNFEIVDHNR